MTQHPLQVAIAHGNAEVRHTLHGAVAQLGHGVCIDTGSGRALIQGSRSRRPDLIIAQESLPDMDGLQAVRQAAGDTAVPTIVVLDRHNGRVLQQPESAHVLGVLQEPVRQADLFPLIPLVMQRFEQLQSLRESIDLLKNEIGDNEWGGTCEP